MLRIHGKKQTPETPYLVSIMHANSLGAKHANWQTRAAFWSLSGLKMNVFWIRPNIDIDSDLINEVMDKSKWPMIHVTGSLKIEEYAPLLANAACFVGNSSSGIREAGYFGTPVVMIGDRQRGRERTSNVMDVGCSSKDITKAVKEQIAHGPYEPDYTYGDGFSGERVAKILKQDLVLENAA
jgi:UDP-N-acetylglucosamine 2-epimerase